MGWMGSIAMDSPRICLHHHEPVQIRLSPPVPCKRQPQQEAPARPAPVGSDSCSWLFSSGEACPTCETCTSAGVIQTVPLNVSHLAKTLGGINKNMTASFQPLKGADSCRRFVFGRTVSVEGDRGHRIRSHPLEPDVWLMVRLWGTPRSV